MRSLMRREFAWITIGLVLFSDGGSTTAEEKKITFVSAEVRYIRTTSGKVLNKTVKLDKTEAVEKLVKFFPTVGRQRESDIAAAWKANVIITLTDKGGQEYKVDTNFEVWSEVSGDWPVVGVGFEEYIVELFKE